MYKEDDTVIVAATRTAIGSFNGVFINTPTYKLGSAVIKSLLEKSSIDPSDVDEIILGQILPAGQGQNPARQAAVDAGRKARVGKGPASMGAAPHWCRTRLPHRPQSPPPPPHVSLLSLPACCFASARLALRYQCIVLSKALGWS